MPESSNSPVPPVIVLSSSAPETYVQQATRMSEEYGYSLLSEDNPPEDGFALYFGPDHLELREYGKAAPGPIKASFTDGKNAHRMQFGGGKGQLIAKAVGVSSGIIPSVLDATAGLGRDAFVLATLGCRVEMFERVPIVEVLLRDALDRAAMHGDDRVKEIVGRMQLHTGDSVAWLRGQSNPVADVIYLDPMYPARDKSAAVKKEMKAFHSLVGETSDDSELLSAALEKARYRVVVKRPRKGEAIAGPSPQLQISGKSSRYDIYTIKSLSHLKGA